MRVGCQYVLDVFGIEPELSYALQDGGAVSGVACINENMSFLTSDQVATDPSAAHIVDVIYDPEGRRKGISCLYIHSCTPFFI